MDKDLKQYFVEINSKIDTLTSHETASAQEIKNLFAYHSQRVKEFQHERFMHLLVTLFFAFIMLVCFAVLIALISFGVAASGSSLLILLATLTSLLLVTTLFYVYHYYKLENGTQKLYAMTKRLGEMLRY